MVSNLGFKMLRLKAGLRQLDVAREIEVSENTVTKWETGRGIPDVELHAKLAKVLGCSQTEVENAF